VSAEVTADAVYKTTQAIRDSARSAMIELARLCHEEPCGVYAQAICAVLSELGCIEADARELLGKAARDGGKGDDRG